MAELTSIINILRKETTNVSKEGPLMYSFSMTGKAPTLKENTLNTKKTRKLIYTSGLFSLYLISNRNS
jgi:hypothetical protein